MITNVGRNVAPKVKNLLAASAIVTGGLLTAYCFKTPAPPVPNESSTRYERKTYENYWSEKNSKPDPYEWNSYKSVASNVAYNAKVTRQHIEKAADKATDHPVPLAGALALELMGIGLASAAIKRNKRIENIETETLEAKKENLKESIEMHLEALEALRTELEEVERTISAQK